MQQAAQPGRQGPGRGISLPPSEDIRAIIVQGDAGKLVKWADALGNAFRRDLSTSQIRQVFGEVRRIDMRWRAGQDGETSAWAQRRLRLLGPRVAYQKGRAQGRSAEALEALKRVLEDAIALVGGDRQRFTNFVDFFEAILAYHRYYGGK